MTSATTIVLRNHLAELERVGQVIAAFGAEHQLPTQAVFDLTLALDEILTNVMSYAYADQGDLKSAIRLLETAPQAPKRPKPHHLRRFYALADLYERAGDLKRSRRLFESIEQVEPGLGDVADRIRQLR